MGNPKNEKNSKKKTKRIPKLTSRPLGRGIFFGILFNTWNCKEKEGKGEENVRIHRKI